MATVLEGQPEPPFYFAQMKKVNKEGPALTHTLPFPERFPAAQIMESLAEGETIVDTRSVEAYAGGHIPGTINIAHTKSYLTWAGWLVSYDKPFTLIVDESQMEDTVRGLRLIGLDDVAGYWTPEVVDSWAQHGHDLTSIDQVSIEEVSEVVDNGEATILDVRGSAEYADGHIPGAMSIPLGYLSQRMDEIPADKPVVVHCQTGVRSSIAASVLERLGRTDVRNYMGSYEGWSSAGKPVETGAAQPEPAVAD